MAYVGQPPQIGQYRKMDDISASFNGVQTAFPITVGGTSFNPATAFAMMVSLGNVVLNPGVAFSITGSTLNFTTPPAASTAFFALIFGDTLFTGTPSDATVTTSKIADGAVTYDKFSTTTQARLTAGQIIFGV